MAKDISNGVEKILETMSRRETNELHASWRAMRNKLDSILLATNVLKSNDAMRGCRALDTMSQEERSQHILDNWGPLYLEKATPMLLQLVALEKNISRQAESDST